MALALKHYVVPIRGHQGQYTSTGHNDVLFLVLLFSNLSSSLPFFLILISNNQKLLLRLMEMSLVFHLVISQSIGQIKIHQSTIHCWGTTNILTKFQGNPFNNWDILVWIKLVHWYLKTEDTFYMRGETCWSSCPWLSSCVYTMALMTDNTLP